MKNSVLQPDIGNKKNAIWCTELWESSTLFLV